MNNLKILNKKYLNKIANIYFIAMLYILLSNYWINGLFIDICSLIIVGMFCLFLINMSIKIKWLAFSLGILTIAWSFIMVLAFHYEVLKSLDLPFFNAPLFIFGVPFIICNVFFSIKILQQCLPIGKNLSLYQ